MEDGQNPVPSLTPVGPPNQSSEDKHQRREDGIHPVIGRRGRRARAESRAWEKDQRLTARKWFAAGFVVTVLEPADQPGQDVDPDRWSSRREFDIRLCRNWTLRPMPHNHFAPSRTPSRFCCRGRVAAKRLDISL